MKKTMIFNSQEEVTEKEKMEMAHQEKEITTNNVDWGYFDRFDKVLDIYLPTRGEGDTKATQLVTAINKIVYKWYNDGDVYDNTAYMEGWFNDISSLANWIYTNYSESQQILDRIYKVYDDAGYEHILKDLADKFFNEEFLKEENNKKACDSIYTKKGKFVFKNKETYEEDWI